MSIDATYLNSLANQIKTDITNVLVNNSISISSFETEEVTSNIYKLIFRVTQLQTTLITNIKVRKSDNSVVSNNDVNIPITTDEVIMRHLITVSEVSS